MARVTLEDVWMPDVYASYGDVNTLEATGIMTSGLMAQNALFDELADSGAKRVEMPFWNDLNHNREPNYSNDNPSDIADIEGLDMGEMFARVSWLNNGWGSADLVAELAGVDPLKKIKQKTGRYWQYQLQHRLVAMVSGLYNANLAQNGGDMIVDLSVSSGTPSAANKWSLEGFIDGVMQKGDQARMPVAIICHSVIYATMLKDDIIETREPSTGQLLFSTYRESTKIILDDGVPTIGVGISRQFVTFVFDEQVIGLGRGTPKVPEEMTRVAEAGNGGGIETLWERRTWMMHPFGYTWTNKQITGPGLSPTWKDLRHAENWARILDRRMVGLTFIVTNQ